MSSKSTHRRSGSSPRFLAAFQLRPGRSSRLNLQLKPPRATTRPTTPCAGCRSVLDVTMFPTIEQVREVLAALGVVLLAANDNACHAHSQQALAMAAAPYSPMAFSFKSNRCSVPWPTRPMATWAVPSSAKAHLAKTHRTKGAGSVGCLMGHRTFLLRRRVDGKFDARLNRFRAPPRHQLYGPARAQAPSSFKPWPSNRMSKSSTAVAACSATTWMTFWGVAALGAAGRGGTRRRS